MDFHSLARRELQTLCKQNKIPANLSNVAMADALSALEVVEGLEELTKSDTASLKTPGKPAVTSSVTRTSTRTRRTKEEPESAKLATRTRRGATETPAPRASARRAPVAQSTQVKAKGETSEIMEKSKTAVVNAYSTRRSTRLVEKMMGELTIGERESLCGTEANMEEELQRGFSDNMENSFDAVEETKVTPAHVVAQPMDDSVSAECILQVEQMNMLVDTCDAVKEQKICTDDESEINKEAMVGHKVFVQQMEDLLGNEKVVGDRILDIGVDGQVKVEKYEDEQVNMNVELQREFTDTTESVVAPDAVGENEVTPCSITASITLNEPSDMESLLDVKPVSEGSTISSGSEKIYCPENAHCTDVEKLNDEAVLFTSDKTPTQETAIDVLMGGLTCAPIVIAEEEKLSSESMLGDGEDYDFVSDSEDLDKPRSGEMGPDGTAIPEEVILKPSTAFNVKFQSDNKENNMIGTPLKNKSLNKLRKLFKERAEQKKLALGTRVDMENRGSSVQ